MLWFLVGTSVLYLVLGDVAEATVLGLSIVPLAGMDAYLHRRTQASTRSLRGLLADRAEVMRGGVRRELPVAELVVGDLVNVVAGRSFPADGVVVGGAELQVDESAVTGESFPVRKRPIAAGAVRADAPLDDVHWAMAGTRLLTGEAHVRLTHTGADTLYGAIVRLAVHGGHLGVGVYRLGARKALVRRAAAVENIGRVTCICTDKPARSPRADWRWPRSRQLQGRTRSRSRRRRRGCRATIRSIG